MDVDVAADRPFVGELTFVRSGHRRRDDVDIPHAVGERARDVSSKRVGERSQRHIVRRRSERRTMIDRGGGPADVVAAGGTTLARCT